VSVSHPVVEIFGPTVQGEGLDQGAPVHFVRFGGCDFRCDWCDTPYAVLPELVRQAERLTAQEITRRVAALGGSPRWVVLSGGNPALQDLRDLVDRLHAGGYLVATETQGSRWRDWLADCDRVCLSPKGPSADMGAKAADDGILAQVDELAARRPAPWAFVKVVVFDERDYEFARSVHRRYPRLPFYLSAGNDAGRTVAAPDRVDARDIDGVRTDLMERARWLVERVLDDPEMADVQIQSQYHVLLWGNERGR
jgi:7-carboxy-7-deazaguanine synthase